MAPARLVPPGALPGRVPVPGGPWHFALAPPLQPSLSVLQRSLGQAMD